MLNREKSTALASASDRYSSLNNSPSFFLFLFFTPFSYQAFDLAYHLWCGSAQKQHETHHAEIHQIESRLKNLENHYRALRRKCDDLKTHQKHQASMEDTVLSSEEDLLDIPIGIPNRSRRGSHASGLTMLGGHGLYYSSVSVVKIFVRRRFLVRYCFKLFKWRNSLISTTRLGFFKWDESSTRSRSYTSDSSPVPESFAVPFFYQLTVVAFNSQEQNGLVRLKSRQLSKKKSQENHDHRWQHVDISGRHPTTKIIFRNERYEEQIHGADAPRRRFRGSERKYLFWRWTTISRSWKTKSRKIFFHDFNFYGFAGSVAVSCPFGGSWLLLWSSWKPCMCWTKNVWVLSSHWRNLFDIILVWYWIYDRLRAVNKICGYSRTIRKGASLRIL